MQRRQRQSYSDHLLDLFYVEGVSADALPGIRTADIRYKLARKLHRERRVRS